MFDMMIDAGPKFYVVRSSTPYMTFKVTDLEGHGQGQGHVLRIFVLKFVFKFLQCPFL